MVFERANRPPSRRDPEQRGCCLLVRFGNEIAASDRIKILGDEYWERYSRSCLCGYDVVDRFKLGATGLKMCEPEPCRRVMLGGGIYCLNRSSTALLGARTTL